MNHRLYGSFDWEQGEACTDQEVHGHRALRMMVVETDLQMAGRLHVQITDEQTEGWIDSELDDEERNGVHTAAGHPYWLRRHPFPYPRQVAFFSVHHSCTRRCDCCN